MKKKRKEVEKEERKHKTKTRTCKYCKRELPVSQFPHWWDDVYEGYLYRPECKDCRVKTHRSYLKKHIIDLPDDFNIDIKAICFDYKTPLSGAYTEDGERRGRNYKTGKRWYRLDPTGQKYFFCGGCKLWYPLTLKYWKKLSNNPLIKYRFGGLCLKCHERMQKFNDIQRNDIDQYGKDVVNTKALASKIFMWVIVRLKPKGKYYEFIDVAYTEKLAKIKLRNIVYGSDYTYEKRKLFKEYEIWKWPIIRKVEEAEKKC